MQHARTIMLILSLQSVNVSPQIHCQVDPRADVDRELYMELPKGIKVRGATHNSAYVLQLVKTLYDQKQAGRVWYIWLTKRLLQMGFKQSKYDPCVFYYKGHIMLVYVGDTILLGPTTN
jgi:hypothetical protein